MTKTNGQLLGEVEYARLKQLDKYFNLEMEDGRSFNEWARARVEERKQRKPKRHRLNVSR